MYRRWFEKSFSGLRTRLVLFVLLAVIPALSITFYNVLDQRQQATEQARTSVLQLAQAATIHQSVMVENTRAFLVVLSHTPALQLNDQPACQELFSHLTQEHYPFYASFYAADLKGNVVCNPPNTHTPDDLPRCEHYNQLIREQDFVLSGYHICKATGKAVLSMGYPVFNPQNELTLVLNVSIDLAWINQLAEEANLPDGYTLYVLDKTGTILAHYPDPDKYRGTLIPDDGALASLLEENEGTAVEVDQDGVERLYAMTPIQNTGGDIHLSLGIPTEVVYAKANQTLWQNLLLLAIVTLAGIVVAWILGEIFFLRQTRSLVTTTRRLADGDLQARTQVPYNQGELGELAQSFDNMAEALSHREAERDQAEQSMKAYAANLERSNRDLQDFANIASHDLQEPLRKIQTFGELLQARSVPQLDERSQDYVFRMQAAAQRMQTLIKDLSNFSRINTHGQPFELVDLSSVARQVVVDLDFQIEQSGAKVEFQSLPKLEADPVQMHQLLQNLIANSIKFRKPGVSPVIQITGQMVRGNHGEPGNNPASKPATCQITVSDNGIGFDEKYAERIFQPFQRLHGRDQYEGTGMGLTICRKIVERHGGNITARGQPGEGATFTIHLPVRQAQENLGDG